MFTVNKQAGFTLLEVIIYIALFSVIVGAGVLSAFNIFAGTARIDLLAKRETELNFMLRKIDWALSGEVISPVNEFSDDSILIFNREGKQYDMYLNDGNLILRDITDTYQLTNVLPIDSISFTRSTIADPDEIEINLTIDGQAFNPIIHYVRTN